MTREEAVCARPVLQERIRRVKAFIAAAPTGPWGPNHPDLSTTRASIAHNLTVLEAHLLTLDAVMAQQSRQAS